MYTEMAVESDDSISELIRAATSSLGYAETRLLQETAVRAFVTGSDVFLSIPTGDGKCFLACSTCIADNPCAPYKLFRLQCRTRRFV